MAGTDFESSTIDGVRVRFLDETDDEQKGWFLARKSNTEPILVMRVEAVNQLELSSILNLINQRVSPIIDISKLFQ